MAPITRGRVTELQQPALAPNSEILFDESLSRIPSVDLKDVDRLSLFLPVVVLVPRSTAKGPLSRQKTSLMKPADEQSAVPKLVGVIGTTLERFRGISAQSTFNFGNVHVNFPSMEVARDGEHIPLTTQEFKTLKYLVQNAGRVISRDELLNEVWGYENYPCTRTVDNHILRLRQKLERDPSRPVHLRTVHGAGYKFIP
jgi:hypothetical protein